MSSKSYLKGWKPWIPAGLVALGIFFGSSVAGTSLPPPGLFPGQDKAVHLLEYGLLGFLVARALRARSGPPRSSGAVLLGAAIIALLYGLSDEFHQSFVPARSVDKFDVLADLVGGATGAALLLLVSTRRSRAGAEPPRDPRAQI
jgi:VanZ family protein